MRGKSGQIAQARTRNQQAGIGLTEVMIAAAIFAGLAAALTSMLNTTTQSQRTIQARTTMSDFIQLVNMSVNSNSTCAALFGPALSGASALRTDFASPHSLNGTGITLRGTTYNSSAPTNRFPPEGIASPVYITDISLHRRAVISRGVVSADVVITFSKTKPNSSDRMFYGGNLISKHIPVNLIDADENGSFDGCSLSAASVEEDTTPRQALVVCQEGVEPECDCNGNTGVAIQQCLDRASAMANPEAQRSGSGSGSSSSTPAPNQYPTRVLVRAGTYTDVSLNMPPNVILQGESGTVLRSANIAGNSGMIRIVDRGSNGNITISDLSISHSGSSHAGSAGVHIMNTPNVTLSNIKFQNSGGTAQRAVYLGHDSNMQGAPRGYNFSNLSVGQLEAGQPFVTSDAIFIERHRDVTSADINILDLTIRDSFIFSTGTMMPTSAIHFKNARIVSVAVENNKIMMDRGTSRSALYAIRFTGPTPISGAPPASVNESSFFGSLVIKDNVMDIFGVRGTSHGISMIDYPTMRLSSAHITGNRISVASGTGISTPGNTDRHVQLQPGVVIDSNNIRCGERVTESNAFSYGINVPNGNSYRISNNSFNNCGISITSLNRDNPDYGAVISGNIIDYPIIGVAADAGSRISDNTMRNVQIGVIYQSGLGSTTNYMSHGIGVHNNFIQIVDRPSSGYMTACTVAGVGVGVCLPGAGISIMGNRIIGVLNSAGHPISQVRAIQLYGGGAPGGGQTYIAMNATSKFGSGMQCRECDTYATMQHSENTINMTAENSVLRMGRDADILLGEHSVIRINNQKVTSATENITRSPPQGNPVGPWGYILCPSNKRPIGVAAECGSGRWIDSTSFRYYNGPRQWACEARCRDAAGGVFVPNTMNCVCAEIN